MVVQEEAAEPVIFFLAHAAPPWCLSAPCPRISDDRDRPPALCAEMPDLRRHGLRSRTEGPHLAQRRHAALRRLPVARAPPHLPHYVRQARTERLRQLESDPVQPGSDGRSLLV